MIRYKLLNTKEKSYIQTFDTRIQLEYTPITLVNIKNNKRINNLNADIKLR